MKMMEFIRETSGEPHHTVVQDEYGMFGDYKGTSTFYGYDKDCGKTYWYDEDGVLDSAT
jgi:hypothetical protein